MSEVHTPTKVFARIFEFFIDSATGEPNYDEEGEPMIGHYYQIIDENENPISQLMGPYSSDDEAANACVKAWDNKSY